MIHYGRRSLMLVGAVLMAATTLIGLGTAGTAGAAGKAKASSTPIKIGVLCSCTGPLASSIDVGPPALQAWADATNARGGINGHKVQIIVKDDAFNSGTSLSEAEQLINQDKVVALVDSSDVDAAWGTYAEQHDVPVIGGGSSSLLFLTNPDFFAVGQTLDDYFINFIDAAKKVGAKNLGEFYCAEAATCQEGVAPLEKTAAKVGEKIGYVTEISASAPNYTAQCLAAKQNGVQALTVADAVSVVLAVAADCTQQGYTPTQIALDGAVSLSFEKAPGINNHFIGSEPDIPFFANNTPAAKAMNDTLKKYAKSTYTSPNFNEQATQMYLTGLLFADAAKAGKLGVHGAPTTAELYKGLYALKGDTLGGLAPPLTFTKGKPTPVDCWYWIRVQKGKFTTPYGTKAVCVKPPVAL